VNPEELESQFLKKDNTHISMTKVHEFSSVVLPQMNMGGNIISSIKKMPESVVKVDHLSEFSVQNLEKLSVVKEEKDKKLTLEDLSRDEYIELLKECEQARKEEEYKKLSKIFTRWCIYTKHHKEKR